MLNVKRQDLGTDIVVLPKRNLVVFHPDLSYSQALGALMAVMPDLHIDVARRTVEKVTPRPVPEPRRWPMIGVRMSIAAAVASVLAWVAMPTAAVAQPEFGQNWSAAVEYLGLDCEGHAPTVRVCRNREGDVFDIHGFRHDTGTLYVSEGPNARVIFVFDLQSAADHYVALHPEATQRGRAVVW